MPEKRSANLYFLLIPFSFLLIFYFFPLSSILKLSFGNGEKGFLQAISDSLNNESLRGILWFTIWQAVLSTALTLILALPGAWIFARFEFPGKKLLRALSAIPFVLPTLVVAAAFSSLLGPSGWLNLTLMRWLNLTAPPIHFLHTMAAILVAHVFYNSTIVLRMVGDFWARLDPHTEQAARTLGASGWQGFRKVTLPLLMPAIIAASLLVFIFNFTSFGVILVLGGPQFATLEVEIYTQTIGLFNLPLAASLATLQLLSTLSLSIIYTRMSAKVSRPLRLRAPGGNRQQLHGLAGRGWLVAYMLLITAFFALPLIGLASRSLTRLDAEKRQRGAVESGFTLDYYRALFEKERDDIFFAQPSRAIQTSLSYAAATVVVTMLVGLPAAWILAMRGESPLSKLLDPLLMLPLGTSAITLGLGFIVALNRPPLDLRASPLLIPLAHTLVALPFVVRSLTPALRSIRPELRGAAAVLGATPSQVLRFVDLPLVGRAMVVAGTFAFAVSMGEFGASALIARPEYPTIPMMIFKLLGQPGAMNYGQAMALSTLLMLVTGAGIMAIEKLRIAEVGEF